MEVAASLTQQGIKVAVVSPSTVPFEKILGQEMGKMFHKLHEDRGVVFHFHTKVSKFEGQEQVERVVLENGHTILTDLVIVGIGVQPNTAYVQDLELAEDQSVPVSEYLQAEAPDLYAAGDIARFPYAPLGKSTRIEHWRLAAQHGRIAAQNMLGHRDSWQTTLNLIPFFWSRQYDVNLRYVGHAETWDEVVIDGNLAEQKFLAYYIKDNHILAVAGCQRDRDIAAISALMRLEKMPQGNEIGNGKINWSGKLSNYCQQ